MAGRRGRWRLPALGLVSLLLYGVLASVRTWSGAEDVGRFLGLMVILFVLYGAALLVLRTDRWREVRWVLLGAVLFRVAVLPAGVEGGWTGLGAADPGELAYETYLLYDNDVWRYLWDGHVLLSGVDTYRHSPEEIDLRSDEPPFEALLDDDRWQEVHARVAYAGYRTVYPPLAQLAFVASAAVAPASAAAWKLLLLAADLLTCWLLVDLLRRRGHGPGAAAIYAWNPLAIKELVGSGHVDALLIACLVLAFWLLDRGRGALALTALGGAILVKLTPLLVVPLFLRRVPVRSWWVLPALAAAAYGPFLGSLPTMVESVGAFARDWTFNPGLWLLVFEGGRGLGVEGRSLADGVGAAAALGLLAFALWRDHRRPEGDLESLATSCLLVLGGYVLTSPTVMPWYLLWALPLCALRPGPAWPAVTFASLASYGIYIDGVERTPWLVVEHGFIVVVLAIILLRGRRRLLPSGGREPT
ncbi:MAG: glycosyltransferase 87 family protein [Acidobacteriota bacterium]